jgi:HlyD family secretion protein
LAAVNEADISQVHPGQKVTFKVDAFPHQTFHGTVSQIRLDSNHIGTVVTYPVVIDADNSDGKLMKDMTAKVQFEEARRGDVLLVPDQALRWRPTWEQISPSARAGLTPPPPRTPSPAEQQGGDSEADEATVDAGTPTVWVRADDGLVRPLHVTLGISDGMVTELTGGDLKVKDELVIDSIRTARPDFVSSFINKIIRK